jgi:ATP-binding cassette subfamily F protein 3
VIVVSHDRTFLNRVAQMLIVFDDDKVSVVYGNYDTYRALKSQQPEGKAEKKRIERPAEPKPAAPASEGSAKPKRKRKFPYRKAADLEAEIAELEEHIQELEAQLASPEVYKEGSKVKDLIVDLESAKAELPPLYEHWEESVELNKE